eukprot:CAMPEP_0181206260 /NCGR_PEP_ID=MMETSP1096-20121128/20936_1 /TAXON_ID=156174 ORGANISM="Chrysochromulina ericina, Strain CCMP281" /NCGR_SAMPLE_ID=MMETSP1096 /ASSEMBLY_ACC=CAM_ASM_000453 /LENGTH=50 /DNA_ID=CAMNT_0023297139 /DNA_START=159 /DNA_END=312 /DNA_ORIENTATION=+
MPIAVHMPLIGEHSVTQVGLIRDGSKEDAVNGVAKGGMTLTPDVDAEEAG